MRFCTCALPFRKGIELYTIRCMDVATTASRVRNWNATPGLFVVSALFHYAGPSFAVLLFSKVDVQGVAWLRVVSAAALFAIWRRPWRATLLRDPTHLALIGCFGAVLAAMNLCFYLAIARLPLATVAAIEFLGPIALAAVGAWNARNALALCATAAGVALLTHARFHGEPVAFAFAFANCGLFLLYIVLGHRIARECRSRSGSLASVDALAQAMLVAAVLISPIGLGAAIPAITRPSLLAAGFGVGICSSVIPYGLDQYVMSRLPRATFALMLALLPACATLIAAVLLHQIPNARDLLGIFFVICGVAVHRPEK